MPNLYYKYIEVSHFEKPQSYMYTTHSGRQFLCDYGAVRDECIAALQKRHGLNSTGGQMCVSCLEGYNRASNELSTDDMICDTESTLVMIITKLTAQTESNEEDIQRWMNFFTKKYEVSKRLYVAYNTETAKPAAKEYQHVRVYALFACALACYYKKNKNLKYLNVLLKVNDLLCSVAASITDAIDGACAYYALVSEKEIVRALCATFGGLDETRRNRDACCI